MALKQEHESYLELFGVARKEKVAKALLADIRFVPRTGERIFIPLNGVRDWDSYTVVAVEYFLGYDKSAGEASRSISGGVGGITLLRGRIEIKSTRAAGRKLWLTRKTG